MNRAGARRRGWLRPSATNRTGSGTTEGSAGNGGAEVGRPSMDRGCMVSAVSDDQAFDAEAVRWRESLNALANEDERNPRCGDSYRLLPATAGAESEWKHSA